MADVEAGSTLHAEDVRSHLRHERQYVRLVVAEALYHWAGKVQRSQGSSQGASHQPHIVRERFEAKLDRRERDESDQW